MTCGFEHVVQLPLHFFPDGVSIRLDDHATAHCALLGQIGLRHKFVIPLGIIIRSFSEVFKFFCHDV